MDHPGVKTLLDRIANQNALNKLSSIGSHQNDKEVIFNTISDHKLDARRTIDSASSQFTKLADFKDSLKQRMKAKRLLIRKEEEEEEKMDEEYHFIKKDVDDDDKHKKAPKEKFKDKIKTGEENDFDEDEDDTNAILGEDDEDEDDDSDVELDSAKKNKKNKNDLNESNDSDTDFKLNLNSDDECKSDENIETKSSSTKTKSCVKKNSVYEFGSDEDDDDEDDDKQSKSSKQSTTQASQIPLTNSIPSNQLTKGASANKFNQNNDLLSQDGLFIEESQQFGDKRRRSLDELTNISFNYDANTSINTSNHNNNHNKSNLDVSNANSENSDELDELAMLCSGQFRGNTQKKSLSSEVSIEEKKTANAGEKNESNSKIIVFENNDLFAADDDDEEEDIDKNKELSKFAQVENFTESSNSNTNLTDKTDSEKLSNDKEQSFKEKKKVLTTKNDDGEEEINENFFENEAELSGSECDSDENYDGESGDDSIMYSGDEDDLPDNSELKEQLGQIFLKDQLDKDNREMRMFKEMYLKEGEYQNKGLRKKKFLWKNCNDDRNDYGNSSSEEEEDDEETSEEETDPVKKQAKLDEKFKRKKEYLIKRTNWRSQRHEREQFHSKNKKDLLLDDESSNEENKNKLFSNSSSNSTENTCDIGESDKDKANRLLRKGQLLLKEGNFKSTKRSLDCLSSCDNLVDLTRSTVNNAEQQVKKPLDNENMFKKFSFLNRDKSYLTRLSSYVNKNISNTVDGNTVQTKSIIRSSNMYFTSLNTDFDDAKNNLDNMQNNAKKDLSNEKKVSGKPENYKPVDLSDTQTVVESKSKRMKHDTFESIFNHI